jgi:hypothetical protein
MSLANLQLAYQTEPWGAICTDGSAATALSTIMALFPAGAIAVVHYFREEQTREELSRSKRTMVHQGSFDFEGTRCTTMEEAEFERATSATCALHVAIKNVEDDHAEILLFTDWEGASERRIWRDGGLPRDLSRVPHRAKPRSRALERDPGFVATMQRVITRGEDDPALYVFKAAMELAIDPRSPRAHAVG